MTTYYMTPIATILQYFSDAGIVLNGGKINTYLAGTSTPQATKTDSTGAVDNANPIILNAAGRLPNVSIWQAQGIKLKIIITDANNNQIGQPIDQVAGIDDPTDLLATLASNSVGSGADLIANAMRSFDLVSSVRAAGAPTLVAGQTRVIDIQAATTPGDNLGGLFYWNATSVLTDDGVSVIKPTGVSGAGRYIRQTAVGSGSFTGTLTGMTGTVTGAINYTTNNGLASLSSSSGLVGVSNSTIMSLTGIPSTLIPTSSAPQRDVLCTIQDNGSNFLCTASFNPPGTAIAFGIWNTSGAKIIQNQSGFTNSGNKGLPAGWSIVYSLL